MTGAALAGLAAATVCTGCGGGDVVVAPASCDAGRVVTVAVVGDSLKRGSEFPASPLRLDKLLQATLDAALGAGRASVRQLAFGGATVADLLAGSHGFEAWPLGIDDDVVVIGFGTNEAAHSDSIDLFTAAWLTLSRRPGVVFATPYPMDTVRPYDPQVRASEDQAYADAIARVALATGVPLIDDHLYVSRLPGWRDRLFDGIHPCGDDGYADHACKAPAAIAAGYLHAQVVRESWAPVLVPIVAARRHC